MVNIVAKNVPGKARTLKSLKQFTCVNCNKIFHKKSSWTRPETKYCSRQCQNEFQARINANKHKEKRITKYCLFCNKELKLKPSRENKIFYCSMRCMTEDYKKRLQGKANPNYKHGSANSSYYRAMRRKAKGTLTNADIEKKRLNQKNKCWWCKKNLKEFHVDHVFPISRGGTNSPDNIVISCPTCNYKKHNKTAMEFAGVFF